MATSSPAGAWALLALGGAAPLSGEGSAAATIHSARSSARPPLYPPQVWGGGEASGTVVAGACVAWSTGPFGLGATAIPPGARPAGPMAGADSVLGPPP